MKKNLTRFSALTTAALLSAPAAFATNGMNMEGYGPIATGMGGASFGYDNGAAALMNNPATLGLMPEGNRLDLAVGRLGPSIPNTYGTSSSESTTTSFYMPAVGFVRKQGAFTYGVGAFAQGGMGTEYAADSFLAMGSNQVVRSEIGIMRVMAPIAYQINPDFVVGATVDYVRATMDFKMAATVNQMGAMCTSSTTVCNNVGLAMGAGTNWARIDFSDDSSFSGAAAGSGFGWKLGAVYKVMPELTVGATYHGKSSMSDLATSATGAAISGQNGFTSSGTLTVRNFEAPASWGIGAAYNATSDLMFAADVKQLLWSTTMQAFNMNFNNGSTMDVDLSMPANWMDQTVVSAGAAYKLMPELTVRGGVNLASNPVPDAYMNPLFPATVANHFTVGAGYAFAGGSTLDGSLSIAPEVTAVNSSAITTKHSQANMQLMYSYKF